MRAVFAFAAVITSALLFAGCGANGTRSFVPGLPTEGGSADLNEAVTKVTVKITVATKSAARESQERQPRYFSAGSKGLLVQAYAHGKNKVAAQFAVSIAPGSKACGGSKSVPRTCAATLMIPATIARADFRISDFNAKPVKSAFPKTAHLLAFGQLLDKKISTKKANDFSVYLGGVVTGLSGNAGFVSFPGDGSAHSLALVIDPVDFGNNPITAGGKDPFANPIVVSLVETGGSGHALLSLNGGTGASRVTVAHSTDTVALDYDGGGSIGYGVTVTLTAPAFKKAGGATENIAVGPLLLGSSRAADYTPGLLALKGNGEWQTVSVGELAAPAGTTYALTTTNCNAIESTMPLVQASAASATFSVITRGTIATPDPAGCVLAVSDGTSTVHVEASNSYSGSLGVPTIATTAVLSAHSAPVEITVGPDGAMWFAECSAGKIGRIAAGPIGTGAVTEVPLPVASNTPQPDGLIAGPDGNLWFTDGSGNGLVGKLTTGGSVTTIPVTPTSAPSFITPGSDGAMWFTFFSTAQIGTVPTSGGTPAYHSTGLTGSYNTSMTLGADGNLWFVENTANKIGKITPAGVISEFSIPHASAAAWDITAGPDGALWFTECLGGTGNTGAIGRIPTTATSGSDIQEFSTNMTGHNPVDITTGPDGAMWFTYWFTNKIGRITTDTHAITEYSIPGANASPNSWGIASGPDGAIWFVDDVDNTIGRIAIASSTAARHAKARR